MLLPISFFILAATCKAIADTLRHHFDTSIFRPLNRNFWDTSISENKKLFWFTKYRLDAWHLANSAMIVAVVLFGVYAKPVFPWKALDFLSFGLLWNGTFNTFYNHILKLDTWQTLRQRIKL